jgi:hypothetical protein
MGNVLQPVTPLQTPQRKPATLLIGIAAVLILLALKWNDVVELVDGEYRLKPKYQRNLERKAEADDVAEQYALVAVMAGWYPCVHSGFARYYLNPGEVWKYGVTTKSELGRYDLDFLRTNRVKYVREFIGTEGQCKKKEQVKLRLYPLLPENLARPEEYRLIRPPFNPIYR